MGFLAVDKINSHRHNVLQRCLSLKTNFCLQRRRTDRASEKGRGERQRAGRRGNEEAWCPEPEKGPQRSYRSYGHFSNKYLLRVCNVNSCPHLTREP